jgi:hypothetical protein
VSLATKLQAGEARARLGQVKARTLDLQKSLTSELQKARAYTDADLSPDGLAKKRQELERAARERLQTELAIVRGQADQDLATMRAFADEDRPKSAASELRQQRLWDRTRMLLESGRSLPQLIAETDDVETLLAIREEAPIWLRAQSQPGAMGERSEPDVAGLVRSVDHRLAETADGLAGVAASWALEADAIEAALQPTLGYLTQEAAGTAHQGQGLQAAIESRMAEREAQRGYLAADEGGEAA